MDPNDFEVMGPGLLSQVPTLGFKLGLGSWDSTLESLPSSGSLLCVLKICPPNMPLEHSDLRALGKCV